MTLRPLALAVMALCVAAAAAADPLQRSQRPKPRPDPTALSMTTSAYQPRIVTVPVFYAARVRPRPRPVGIVAQPRVTEVASAAAVSQSRRPPVRRPRSERRQVVRAAVVRTRPAPVRTGAKPGPVCGDRGIRGIRLAPIQGRLSACSIPEPVRVMSVSGLVLSRPAIMDCPTAKALKTWADTGVKPVVGRQGGGAAGLWVLSDYSCRTRNNRRGAKISEHARGRAIDVAGITLKDGATISVRKGWRDPRQGKLLRAMQARACGPFGTVLGPNSDRYHQDHFHLDTARYRSGPYCR